MYRLRSLLAATVLLFTALPPVPAAAQAGLPTASPESQGFSPERLERLHAALRGFAERGDHAGVAMLLARNGKTVDLQAWGQRDREQRLPMERDTIVRIYSMYEPLKVFTYIGAALFGLGFLLTGRFLYNYLTDFTGGGRYVQSLIISAVLMIVGFQVVLIGLLADVISANRKLLEDLLYRVRSMELDAKPNAPDGHRRLTHAAPKDRWEH